MMFKLTARLAKALAAKLRFRFGLVDLLHQAVLDLS